MRHDLLRLILRLADLSNADAAARSDAAGRHPGLVEAAPMGTDRTEGSAATEPGAVRINLLRTRREIQSHVDALLLERMVLLQLAALRPAEARARRLDLTAANAKRATLANAALLDLDNLLREVRTSRPSHAFACLRRPSPAFAYLRPLSPTFADLLAPSPAFARLRLPSLRCTPRRT